MVKDIVGLFGNINNDTYQEYGINKGDLVFVAGSGYAPVDDKDNYKLLFVVSLVIDGKPQGKGFAIARESLDLLSDEESEKLRKSAEEVIERENQQDKAK